MRENNQDTNKVKSKVKDDSVTNYEISLEGKQQI
jgi:hypothetical protein